jgi:hypothetical protein
VLYGIGDGLSDVAMSLPEVVKLSVPGLRDPAEEAYAASLEEDGPCGSPIDATGRVGSAVRIVPVSVVDVVVEVGDFDVIGRSTSMLSQG